MDEPLPTPAVEAELLIVSDDDGEPVYVGATSALIFRDIANEAGYDAVLRSTSDGEVTLEELQAYDAVIWCTGDYQEEGGTPAQQDMDALIEYLYTGGGVVLMGAFLGDPDDSGQLLDIQVMQGDHPLARGFETDQIIDLDLSSMDEGFAPHALLYYASEEIIFARGPKSELSEAAVIAAIEGDELFGKVINIGFPIYLLSDEDAMRLGTNVIVWIMEE
jgi:hypothetical protein